MTPWKSVALGELLRRSEESVEIWANQHYREVTVRLWGKGITERGVRSGSEISSERRGIIRKGQLLLSRIDARNGALGIVPEHLDGSIASNDFPSFEIVQHKADPAFMGWLVRTEVFVDLCRRASEGTTNRIRLKEDRFLAMNVLLPPVEEQRCIVARIEQIAAKVGEAASLTAQNIEMSKSLCRTILASDSETRLPMCDLVTLREPDVSVRADCTYAFAGVLCFGRGAFASQTRTGSEFAYKKLTTLRSGDFLYPKLMAWEGAFAVVPEGLAGRVVSPEFPVFEVNTERILPEVLDVYFRTPEVWVEVAGKSTGTNVRRRRLNPRDFLRYTMPVPSRHTQEKLQAVYRRVQVLHQLRSDNLKRLQTLLPAFLNGLLKTPS